MLYCCTCVQVQGVCKGIMQMLGNLAGEYEKLLARVAVRQEPLALGQELQVGQRPLVTLCI